MTWPLAVTIAKSGIVQAFVTGGIIVIAALLQHRIAASASAPTSDAECSAFSSRRGSRSTPRAVRAHIEQCVEQRLLAAGQIGRRNVAALAARAAAEPSGAVAEREHDGLFVRESTAAPAS